MSESKTKNEGERKRESCSESKSLIIEEEAKNCKQKDMLKQRKNTYSVHDYTNDLFAIYSFFFFIKLILLDSVFFYLKILVLLGSEKMLLYLYATKLIPYVVKWQFYSGVMK